ncbi:carbamoyltransferase family protein [Methyloversatilis sp. RAC08]|uniref:carbamoyltransferase C-terminal domain-containing protein n=1 Tax=Methyloversatilis sp. RAC08 TaxID=1842540 RepID=UPI000857C2F9|nr:carbamoyltransferase C-terminal domain-containing protein [Methyloversatilis sp. RAC08]AOF82420.1 carbamoyltransferase family protein [Methyloversatilis sp. RAC08]
MSNSKAISLGIHVGHDAACAVAIDGHLVAAIQQERVTRRKHDGQECLSNRLPIHEVLQAAGVSIDDVQRIVSSHQSAAPGGIGFGKELVSPDFSRFTPTDSRHFAISHHLAHAYCVAPYLNGDDCAILVTDLAGSTTHDGKDYEMSFSELVATLRVLREASPVRTECLSIYKWEGGRPFLVDREFAIPHSEPDCFVFSPASLYDNASQSVFAKPNCYGQLMALASYGAVTKNAVSLSIDEICQVHEHSVAWLNGWQSKAFLSPLNFEGAAAFASVVQRCTEESILAYARRAYRLTGAKRLAVSGGLFLNINTNSRLAYSGLFEHISVPSAPGDAGIAVGCAMYGQASLGVDLRGARSSSDRLGPVYAASSIRKSAESFAPLVMIETLSVPRVASDLRSGHIVARCSGRSEFGPRALGGRSLLASPLDAETKNRLNQLKGRQHWRPVAPVVLEERFADYFEGPPASPFMSFVHKVKPEQRSVLLALEHPDHSTRAQTLDTHSDAALRELLLAFEQLTGHAMLVNTSLNGPDEPIVETPEEALRFFIKNAAIDALIIENLYLRRARRWDEEKWKCTEIRLASDCITGGFVGHNGRESRIYRASKSIEVSEECCALLTSHALDFLPTLEFLQLAQSISASVPDELHKLVADGWLEWRRA